ncbi:UV radiation resistance-associated protein isoform X1 [Cinnamomum micranthum f. kanehirae]|uniref:UV radiation resistance-associated protein isoform X1 n=1 Tax=Cinnamomum micranthum f. kanehirae TaxID=337451 RepID=A0A443NMD1_9MAGN|nr:UV radiation resistance-associated protein isoform X1 [Cinnamomum micranthum f. kanehirae]
MRKKLEAWKLVLGNLLMQSKTATADIKNQTEQLSVGIRSLLVAGKALSVARNQFQLYLTSLKKGSCSPKKLAEDAKDEAAVHDSTRDESGSSATSTKTNNPGMSSLTILGLQLTVPPLKKMSFFSDKKAHKSATALGYVAHAPSIEPASTDLASNSIVLTNTKAIEFPLFLEGQDTTKAAYAIFLLNKLLNFAGIQSLGPRHVLANLKELFRTIQSRKFIDS